MNKKLSISLALLFLSGFLLLHAQISNPTQIIVATLTTTAAASDNVALPGMKSTGHCQLTATEATGATNIATTYVSAKTTNQITVTHSVTASMVYDVSCTAY